MGRKRQATNRLATGNRATEPCLPRVLIPGLIDAADLTMVRVIPSQKTGRTHDISDTTEVRTNYEPQSDTATRRMLASATGMAAASSFGSVFVEAIVSALLLRIS